MINSKPGYNDKVMVPPASGIIEKILVFTLSGLSLSIFFSQTGIDVFGLTSLLALLIWKYVLKYELEYKLPVSLKIIAIAYLLGLLLSALRSGNSIEGFNELKKYWSFFLAGLLFTAPMNVSSRRKIIIVFFIGAGLSGLQGIYQYYGIQGHEDVRAKGFTHPIHYAANLAFAFAGAIIILFIHKGFFHKSEKKRYLIVLTALLSLFGIVLSQSRGVWIAVVLSCLIVLALYDYRRALIAAFSFLLIFLLIFSLSGTLRQRASSIFTSAYSENEMGSTGNRLELWKGSLLIGRQHPILGAGIGDFKIEMNKLIENGSIKAITQISHAHNIFLHALATQGIIGLMLLLAFLSIMMSWGLKEIRNANILGGYMIIASTLLTIFGGITENNIGISKYIAACCLTTGLIGGYDKKQEGDNCERP